MQTQDFAYDMCRRFITDSKGHVTEDLTKRTLGYVRGRNLSALCDSMSLYTENIHSVFDLIFLRQVSAFFKKNSDFADDDVCLTAAKSAFWAAEATCKETNARLDDPALLDEYRIEKMRFFIADLLGELDCFVRDIPVRMRVTAGATATRSRKRSLPFMKVNIRNVDCTPGSAKYLRALGKAFGYPNMSLKLQNWNRVEFVPKNWKTHRTIACEPSGVVPLQLAFDSYVKDRLRRKANINLSHQSRNQELSRLGSIDNSFATVDLKAASDTVSKNLITLLFPREWERYLTDVRCSHFLLEGEMHRYEKFSSMGNGSTFALETLIFLAACRAVGSTKCVVYGDDIVIEDHLYGAVTNLLAFLGFEVNLEKSYHGATHFRESCGTDWFNGILVTPVYLRQCPRTKPELCHYVNELARISYPEGQIWKFLKELVRDHKLLMVPFNLDTSLGVWITPHDAYRRRIIRSEMPSPNGKVKSKWVPCFRGYVTKSKNVSVATSQTLFLWHLAALARRDTSSTLIESSRVPTLSHKYVRKWVSWVIPTRTTPDHLYWWTDFLSSPE